MKSFLIRNQRRLNRRGNSLVIVLVLIAISASAIGGWIYYRNMDEYAGMENQPIVDLVSRGPFDHVVLEQGEVGSSSNNEIKCEVEARGSQGTPILWVIDEGSYVKAGDKLCQLDASALENEIKGQRIVVSSAEALVIGSDAAVRQGVIGRQEYLEGIYQTDRKLILSEISIAEQEKRKAELSLASAERLAAKGTLRPLQIQAEEFSVQNSKNILESATSRLRVLDELTKEKMLVQLDSTIETAKAKLESDRSVLLEEKLKLEELEQQIRNCTINAPTDGQVVHANSKDRRGNAEFVVEAGSMVREQQTIFLLPDPTKMEVTAKINESRIMLIREGMPVKIKVGLQELVGRVSKVNKYAEAGGWFSSSVKEYATTIAIIDPPATIRTGMTAEVQIFVEQIDDTLQIPVQGVYEVKGHHLVLQKLGENKFATKEVKVGATNEKFVTVQSGLNQGDRVVLNPRQHEELMQIPEFADATDREKLVGISNLPKFDQPTDAATEVQPTSPGGKDPSQIVTMILESSDANKDGKISADEAAANPRMKDKFASQDTNKDGFLDKAELTAGMKNAMKNSTGGYPGGGGMSGSDAGGAKRNSTNGLR